MCLILEELQQYVPTVRKDECMILPDGSAMPYKKVDMWEVLLGGDQLTAARVRGAAAVRANHPTASDRLQGLFPTVEDWHCRMTFLKVC